MTDSKRAYNLQVTQITDAVDSTNSNGTRKITMKGTYTAQGKVRTRTVVAQGKAADQVAAIMGKDSVLGLRCVFDRAPANDDGSRGGEFLTVVDLPREKKAA